VTRHAQEPVRPFPVVLRPRPDELLSSWLTRHATYYGVTRRRLLDHVGILSPSVEALDREITLGQQIMLAGYFRRQPFEIAAMSYEMVRSNMRALIRPSAPQQSCQACAEKAERADAKGAIGKSWMQGWRITCRVCGARLTDEDDPQMAQASAERFSDYWDSALDGESMFEIYASAAERSAVWRAWTQAATARSTSGFSIAFNAVRRSFGSAGKSVFAIVSAIARSALLRPCGSGASNPNASAMSSTSRESGATSIRRSIEGFALNSTGNRITLLPRDIVS